MKSIGAPTINMENDLKRLINPLKRITEEDKQEEDSSSKKVVFDTLHLSPLKVNRKKRRR